MYSTTGSRNSASSECGPLSRKWHITAVLPLYECGFVSGGGTGGLCLKQPFFEEAKNWWGHEQDYVMC